MSKRLKFFFKAAVVSSFAYGLFVLLFLQEITIFGDSFVKACNDQGIGLPLSDPRILIDISDSTLTINDGDKLIRRYDIATGTNRISGILSKEGESTPIGEYKVIRKAIRESVFFQGSRFLQIDFPSEDDIENAWEQGLINSGEYARYYEARDNNRPPPPGLGISRSIGIRGNYFAISGPRSTNGAVAMSNGDINEIFEYIPIGTPVVIRP